MQPLEAHGKPTCPWETDPAGSSLRRLFDFLPKVLAWIKDREGLYRWVNRGFLLNHSLDRPEDVVGKTDYDFSPKYLADQFRMDDEMVLQGRSIAGRVELVGRFDHTARWCVTSKLPLVDSSGEIVATSGLTYPLAGSDHPEEYRNLALGKVIARMRQDYAQPLSNRTLASVAGLSVRAMERNFRQDYFMSPQQYLRRLRVRMSCLALVQTQQSMAAIAASCGFCDQAHFAREFHRQVGVSPRQYRQQYQQG